MPERATNPSNSKLTVGLVAALVVSLVTVAFLLGRESTRDSSAPPALSTTTPVPAEREAPSATADHVPPREVESEAELAAEEVEAAEEEEVSEPDEAERKQAVQASPGEETPSTEDGDQAEVDTYFREMKSIQAGATISNPNAFAMELAQAAGKGDTSGFDRLIADTQSMESELKALKVPTRCKVHHVESLALLRESREMLGTLRDAIESKDLSALGTMNARAQALQERAKKLEELEMKIRD